MMVKFSQGLTLDSLGTRGFFLTFLKIGEEVCGKEGKEKTISQKLYVAPQSLKYLLSFPL